MPPVTVLITLLSIDVVSVGAFSIFVIGSNCGGLGVKGVVTVPITSSLFRLAGFIVSEEITGSSLSKNSTGNGSGGFISKN